MKKTIVACACALAAYYLTRYRHEKKLRRSVEIQYDSTLDTLHDWQAKCHRLEWELECAYTAIGDLTD